MGWDGQSCSCCLWEGALPAQVLPRAPQKAQEERKGATRDLRPGLDAHTVP